MPLAQQGLMHDVGGRPLGRDQEAPIGQPTGNRPERRIDRIELGLAARPTRILLDRATDANQLDEEPLGLCFADLQLVERRVRLLCERTRNATHLVIDRAAE